MGIAPIKVHYYYYYSWPLSFLPQRSVSRSPTVCLCSSSPGVSVSVRYGGLFRFFFFSGTICISVNSPTHRCSSTEWKLQGSSDTTPIAVLRFFVFIQVIKWSTPNQDTQHTIIHLNHEKRRRKKSKLHIIIYISVIGRGRTKAKHVEIIPLERRPNIWNCDFKMLI